jgi:hypothetical protein
MVFMYKYKNKISYSLILLLSISPITLRGDDIVACINFSEKSVHLELPHNQHVIPEAIDASCNHDHEDQATSCDTRHKHDDCSDIPFAIKVVRLRNNEESSTFTNQQQAALSFAPAQVLPQAQPVATVLKLRISIILFTAYLQPTILLC